jgi:hypothetical protein
MNVRTIALLLTLATSNAFAADPKAIHCLSAPNVKECLAGVAIAGLTTERSLESRLDGTASLISSMAKAGVRRDDIFSAAKDDETAPIYSRWSLAVARRTYALRYGIESAALESPERIEAMDQLIDWLPGAVPPDEITTLVHGDFRLDNLVFDADKPKIAAVLDWELSTLGSPLADFAYHCCVWHFPAGLYRGLSGVPHPAGIPPEGDYRRLYSERSGQDADEHWDYYIAYNFFRMAAIVQGILKRSLEGTAAAANAEAFGRGARRLADMGWARVEQIRTTR